MAVFYQGSDALRVNQQVNGMSLLKAYGAGAQNNGRNDIVVERLGDTSVYSYYLARLFSTNRNTFDSSFLSLAGIG
jgi:hypothetical protein